MREVKERNIVLAVILSIVTCGIYGLYWNYCLNEDINELANDREATGGVMVIVLTFITCYIYGIYWMYKMGEKCDIIAGNPNGSTKWIYLILALVFPIAAYCLMQDTINKHANTVINA